MKDDDIDWIGLVAEIIVGVVVLIAFLAQKILAGMVVMLIGVAILILKVKIKKNQNENER